MTRRPPHPSAFDLDELPLSDLGLPGRLVLTGTPGRTDLPELPADPQRTEADLRWLREAQGVDVVVGLLQAFEYHPIGDLPALAEAAGLRYRALPLPDGLIPVDTLDYGREVLRAAKALTEGRTVAVHCWAGLGRTGTFAAGVLQALGLAPQQALKEVRAARPGTVANDLQEAFVVQFPEVLAEVRAAKARLQAEVAGPKPIEAMDLAELRHELYEARRLLAELTRLMRR